MKKARAGPGGCREEEQIRRRPRRLRVEAGGVGCERRAAVPPDGCEPPDVDAWRKRGDTDPSELRRLYRFEGKSRRLKRVVTGLAWTRRWSKKTGGPMRRSGQNFAEHALNATLPRGQCQPEGASKLAGVEAGVRRAARGGWKRGRRHGGDVGGRHLDRLTRRSRELDHVSSISMPTGRAACGDMVGA